MSHNRFQYQARPVEAWQERSTQTGGGFVGFIQDSVNVFNPQKENWVRLLPPTWENPRHYGYPIFVHFGVGPQSATVLCPLKMYNERCPQCETYSLLDTQGQKEAYNTKAKNRILVWLINRKSDKQNGLPEAWAMPWTLDRDISRLCIDKQSGELYQIDHPDNGYDVTFERIGEVPKIDYIGVQIARRPTSIEDRYLDYIMEHPLPTTLIRRGYSEILHLMEGQVSVSMSEPAAQQVQQQPSRSPSQNELFGPSTATVVAPTQQPTSLQPQQIQYPYCPVTVTVQGQVIACAQPQGHQGDHLFDRIIQLQSTANTPEQTLSTPPFSAPQPIVQPRVVVQPPQSATPTSTASVPVPPSTAANVAPPSGPVPGANASPSNPVGIRATSLRERFANGRK